ncbi:MAG: efflux RND transporter periplasmic adaptor subunit [Candidatus Margulisiibacteriota bacterium]
MKKIKRPYIVIGAVAALAIGLFYFSSCRSSVKVSAAKVEFGSIVPVVSVYGEIKGISADLSPKVPGIVSRILVKEGAKVKKGQILLEFDNFETAGNDLARMKNLYKSGFATKQQFEQAKLAYDNAVLVSPINGIVTLVANRTGETASPGIVAVSVIDIDSAYAELQIDEADIGDVNVGQDVKIYADAYPNESFDGKLDRVVQSAELKKVGGRIKIDEEDKIFRGKVLIENPEQKLRIGMSINADIITQVKENILLTSREAIYSKDGKDSVFVIKNKRVKAVPVEIGLKDNTNVEILKGLSAGDIVAASMLDTLKNNVRVEIIK